MEELDHAAAASSSADAAVNIYRACNELKEGIELIKERIKLMVSGEQSEVDLSSVKEYERNCVADDSEDEKKIR